MFALLGALALMAALVFVFVKFISNGVGLLWFLSKDEEYRNSCKSAFREARTWVALAGLFFAVMVVLEGL
ncbi:MAG: hypothetical protein AAFX45_09550 [Pseudomonadota bacterium]